MDVREKRPPFDLTATLRTVLTLTVFAAIGVAGGVAWATLHPLAGAGVWLVGYAAWWKVVAAEAAEAARQVEMARALARDRAPLSTSFEDPGPVDAPWQGGTS